MEDHKHIIDLISIGTMMTSLIGILPPIAALASLIWTCIRIYETKTVQRWLRGNKFDRRKKKLE